MLLAPPPPASLLAPIHGVYAPAIDPAKFGTRVDNPYFPLEPGTTFHMVGVRGRTPQTDDSTVLHRRKRVLGISCTVVKDTVSEHGRPIELTYDWYGQDRQGNVWYMGENSLERSHGRFAKASDSWASGVDGAKPGIIMPARPRVGDAYRQEYYPPGQALDEARVVRLRPLVTYEFSPAEPQTERKVYVRGVGEIGERVIKGHHEAFTLVSVTRR